MEITKTRTMYYCPICGPSIFGKMKKIMLHLQSHDNLKAYLKKFSAEGLGAYVIQKPKGTIPTIPANNNSKIEQQTSVKPNLKGTTQPISKTVIEKKSLENEGGQLLRRSSRIAANATHKRIEDNEDLAIKLPVQTTKPTRKRNDEIIVKTDQRSSLENQPTYKENLHHHIESNEDESDYSESVCSLDGGSDDGESFWKSVPDSESNDENPNAFIKKHNRVLNDFFFQTDKDITNETNEIDSRRVTLAGETTKHRMVEHGLLGRIIRLPQAQDIKDKASDEDSYDKQVYLNTHVPFALVSVGVQGAGKSHTLGVIIENCMLEVAIPENIIELKSPMTTLVFHYDPNPTNICEATGLIEDSHVIKDLFARIQRGSQPSSSPPFKTSSLDRSKLLVLCSPSYYHQRKQYYGDYCEVRPLMFPWATLTAKQIKTLMRINENDSQLYVASMLDLLRRYQRENLIPDFADFIRKIESTCSASQISPLKQRQALLESIILESEINKNYKDIGVDLHSCMKAGMLVVADLTDPLLSADEANGIFEVLLEQFRAMRLTGPGGGGGGKLVALDEAHKFMSASSAAQHQGLSRAIVDTVRLMRHEGIRVAISSQNPQVLAPELLELVTVAIIHRFHSSDWFSYLKAKIPLKAPDAEQHLYVGNSDDYTLEAIRCLPSGQAIVFAASSNIKGLARASTIRVSMRPRLTADRGASRANTISASTATATKHVKEDIDCV